MIRSARAKPQPALQRAADPPQRRMRPSGNDLHDGDGRRDERVAVGADSSPGTVSFRVDLKPDFRPRRGPTGTEEGYR